MAHPMPPSRPSRPPRRSDPAAGWGPSPLALGALLLVATGLLAWWAWPDEPAPGVRLSARPAEGPAPDTTRPAATAAASVASAAADGSTAPASERPAIPRHRDPEGDQTPDLADYVNPGEMPTMTEVIERLRAAGVSGGLAAFNPPGTRPPLVGLAVPEGYALPPGYVRHHQSTDDGQRLEPILMYSPDHPPPDAQGRPLALPADRVVPADAAPPGLPIRQIVVPAPLTR